MRENPQDDIDPQGKRRSYPWTAFTTAAAILAVVQACLTIRGRGIEGFILWILILFAVYLLLFTFLRWLFWRLRDRR